MAQWKETLEPYVKVYETVKNSVLNPSAGGELIIGCALISDAGPSVPTLITSQSEFMKTYASRDITADYIGGLDQLYVGMGGNAVASTMWMNAYRLAGSNTILAVRACKATDIFAAKPLVKDSIDSYISRDGALMKRMADESIKLVLDTTNSSGWAIDIDGVGIFGNYTTDTGAMYDYYVDNLVDLVDQLNETSKFFSPNYTFYDENDGEIKLNSDSDSSDKSKAKSVLFNELYLSNNLINTEPKEVIEDNLNELTTTPAPGTPEPESFVSAGMYYVLFKTKDNNIININDVPYSGFKAADYYATNVFNSASDLKVRIRRFNHNAVISKTLSDAEKSSLTVDGASPYTVLTNVLDTYVKNKETEKVDTTGLDKSILDKDFYEIAVVDPSVSEEVLFFNIGKIPGRGDMEASEVNDSLKMIQLVLPDNMIDLKLNYFGYDKDNTSETYDQIWADLTIDPKSSSILNVSDTDLKKALDLISLDEIYVTEGLCDLGNTELSYQSYMANMAINENYFYPISTVNSTNYLTIANNAAKISQDSYKLYMSAPWDIDTGTMGWKTYMSPSVLYWEAVARNRRNNEEFRGIIGQSGGIVQYQKPMAEFNKKTRQLLLSKRINTVLWNTQTSAWNMNDNYTKQSVENIMSDDGNSRLAIRISKAMPVLLRQFIGRKINAKLWEDAKGVINYWFTSTILPMQFTVSEFLVIIDESNNPIELQRQNKMAVTVNVRYANTLKYITVYHNILEVGMDITAI